MKNKMKKIITLICIALILLANSVLAIPTPEKYDYTNSTSITKGSSQSFLNKVAPVLGFLQNLGVIVAVLVLAIIGLKYMFCSVEQKAEYKKSMFPYILGCFMIMGVSVLLGVIQKSLT